LCCPRWIAQNQHLIISSFDIQCLISPIIFMPNVLIPLESLAHINGDEKADWMVCVEKVLWKFTN
jgi:hypothetical protein